jgi:hypothetical protein
MIEKVNVTQYEHKREDACGDFKQFKKVFEAATGRENSGGIHTFNHCPSEAVHHSRSAPLYSRTKLNWMWQCSDGLYVMCALLIGRQRFFTVA